ncbi:GH92 family glycosyl hydrolase [Sporolactobacillus sp. CPB3-1]|uniref:GH92 family glycosyl hydrolase n=1 Tax=Sporolactobacillus mangiferae TaxID=2940498 RepID=A0ABT0MB24_9BACL|nr:GH92 family glycosyl hydrolase [Sporolactobacillus mangiferae]MCL1632073.1 GH92 family glycosyl hydrolase [Sporolactobacillus mangiferae]
MASRFSTKLIIFCVCLSMIIFNLPGQASGTVKAAESSSLFTTSFEKGEQQPTWTSTPERTKNEKTLTSGITALNGNGHTMTTLTSNGPDGLYNAAKNAGWSGTRVLTYSGASARSKKGYAYNKLFRVHIPVAENTELSYMIAPQPTKKDSEAQAASYVSIDLAFSDGTYLSQMNAKDQDGITVNPKAQGKSGTLLMNQWNQKKVELGNAAKGKTIVRILLAYHAPKTGVTFKGAIDDIRIGASSTGDLSKESAVDQVNILRGTQSGTAFARGNTTPAIGVPNGFSYWAPALNSSAKEQIYPYSKNNDPNNLPEIQSFSLSQSANDQNGSRQSLQIMPSGFSGTPSASRVGRSKAFKRADESASPYRYAVKFTDGMRAELSATSHASIMHFTFTGNQGSILFDNLDDRGNVTLHPENRSLEGYSDIKNTTTGAVNRLFFYAKVDRPVSDAEQLSGEDRDHVTSFFRFDTSKHRSVTLRMGISLIGTKQAEKNLDQEIDDKTSIKDVEKQAKKAWNQRLKRISIEGAQASQQITLYSNLYRLYLSPNDGSENTGSRKHPDYRYADLSVPGATSNTTTKTGAPVKKGQVYVNSRFAYSMQTVWPAYALLEPHLTGQLINGFLTAFKNGGGFDRDAGTAFADAVIKGVPGVHETSLYQAMLHAASTSEDGQDHSLNSYVPSSVKNSVRQTLTQAANDYALGKFAGYLAHKHPENTTYADDSSYYLSRAQNYLHLFNRSLGRFAARQASGKWAGSKSGTNQTDDSAYAFYVPQDGQALINLFGGKDQLIRQLDTYLNAQPDSKPDDDADTRLALSGKLGQFALDRPASPSLPYMYLTAAAPWMTQSITRTLLNRFYTGGAIGQGYLGSDTGSMLSGYYLFGAAGIYPLQKGSSDYVISAPYFKRMIIRLDNGKELVISAPEASDQNKYVQGVILNGQPLRSVTLSADMLKNGGTLVFDMGTAPSSWGTSSAGLPDSMTAQSTSGSSLFPKPLDDQTTHAAIRKSSSDQAQKRLIDDQAQTATVFDQKRPSIIYHFKAEKRRIKLYTLTSSEGRDTSDPKNWSVWGSNDGTNWDLLDTRVNQSFKWRGMTRGFSIKNPKAYAYYKLEVTKSSSDHPLALGEMQLLGYSGIESGFNAIRSEIIHQFELKNLTESETASLSHALTQAQTAYMDGNLSTSIYYMQSYVQLINSFIYKAIAPEKVRSSLSADAHAMVNLLSD